jgi:hypothetical protein
MSTPSTPSPVLKLPPVTPGVDLAEKPASLSRFEPEILDLIVNLLAPGSPTTVLILCSLIIGRPEIGRI